MRQRLSSSPVGILFFVGLLMTPVGCGDNSGPAQPPVNPLASVTLSTSTTGSFGKVHLIGMPSGKEGSLVPVLNLLLDGAPSVALPIETDTEGPFFWAPLHPAEPNVGGSVQLQITDGVQSGPVLTLDVAALPAAPGAYARVVATLRAHIEQRAIWAGTSFAALQAMTFADTPPRWLALKIAQSYVESGNDDADLTSIVDNAGGFLSADGRELLDRLFGYAPLDVLLQGEIDAFAELQGLPTPSGWTAGKVGGCINAGPDISSAQELSDAMLLGAMGDAATNPSGPAGQTLQSLGLTLTVGGAIPGPGGTAISVVGAGLAAWQAATEFLGGVYPTDLASISFAIDRTSFPEDETGFATWSAVMLTATSSGWTADQSIANVAVSTLGAALSAGQVLELQAAELTRDVGIAGLNLSLGAFLGALDGGIVEFCSGPWVVDISEVPFNTAQVLDRKFAVDIGARQVRPLEVGSDVLRVAAQPSQFAGQEVHADVALETKAIDVDVTPTQIIVQNPGDEFSITATIENAEVETLEWTSGPGTWMDGIGADTNGGRTRPLKTPTNEQVYPFFVIVESTSTGGLRADRDPPRLKTVTVRLQATDIVVDPQGLCLANAVSQPFTAMTTDGDDVEVVWTLEDPDTGTPSTAGSITESGQYTTPVSGAGEVLVVATSVASATTRGSSLVRFGACECYWQLNIIGEGAWIGDSASHDFGTLLPWFSMNLAQFDPTDEGLGAVQVVNGPGPDELGSWPALFTFSADTRTFVASEGDNGTTATLAITTNTTAVLMGTISGTCSAGVIGEEVQYRQFSLTFRSNRTVIGESICGGN